VELAVDPLRDHGLGGDVHDREHPEEEPDPELVIAETVQA
jgi:hypothetical protein